VALDCLPDFTAHRFLCFNFYFFLFLVIGHAQETKLASFPVNFWTLAYTLGYAF